MVYVYRVSVPYEITLLSNAVVEYVYRYVFQYLMKLHYSQTLTYFLIVEKSFSTL